MATYVVTMGRPGGGAGTFKVIVYALSPGMARHAAEAQYPGMSAQAVRAH
jgi:hypothetical protein